MPGFNHIRVRKSYSRDTIMVSPVDENGADRYADASNPHVVQAVSHATIVDDECNGGISNTHLAYQYLADALGSVRVLRRGPEMSGGPEPRPSLPSRIKTQTMVNFTRGVYPPQPPIPADQLAILIKDIDILTRDEYRQQVGQEEFDLVTVW
ncbi:hypothetical protein CspHIS471_0100350 [Cutaneotrichosporon sp. HIS471]|nr:hypothetical protein CspHIS471_0100350 [Cutaneotrichosporon sp. HIS471]